MSQTPLYLGTNMGPNVMITMDDSGSMMFEAMPESVQDTKNINDSKHKNRGSSNGDWVFYMYPPATNVYGGSNYTDWVVDFDASSKYATFMRSSQNNTIYYNPAIRYDPWAKADGTFFPAAIPTAAYNNPADTTKGTRNLTVSTIETARWMQSDGNSRNTSITYYPATYFRYDGGDAYSPSNYTKIEIKSSVTSYPKGTKRTDCAGSTCTYAEEIQNFANWYSYYRSRILMARGSLGLALAKQASDPTSPSIMRIGYSTINKASSTVDGVVSTGGIVQGLRKFSGQNRIDFFNTLYGSQMDPNGTPSRKGLDAVGQYFQRTDNKGPWGENPGTEDTTPHRACRQSHNIFATDGYWNGSAASTAAATGNVDGTAGSAITDNSSQARAPYTYSPVGPFMDNESGTLADVAMYYWKRDLRPDLANKVIPSSNDDNSGDRAFWQHLATHTIGLGVDGTLDADTAMPDLRTGAQAWPKPCDGCGKENIDDLWHTAVNGHGTYFNATDPDSLSTSLNTIFSIIIDRDSAAAAVALNTGSITANSRVYQAKFNSAKWSGTLTSTMVNSDGTLGAVEWDASTKLDAQDYSSGRRIVTYKPSTKKGIPFRWPVTPAAPSATELDVEQSNALKTSSTDTAGSTRLDFLRGRSVTGYRLRSGKLGDIVYSSPAVVGPPRSRFADNWGTGQPETSTPYSTFKSTKATRGTVVYVGANDGMLHAFDGSVGAERFAFVPNTVFGNLLSLADAAYSHRYFVDGAPTVADVMYDSAWHTVLVGGLRAGGQGYYALDITDPPTQSDSETSVATHVLWEFTDVNDPDLGNTFSDPNIVRMHNGKWAAVFGNGYNSTANDGHASTTGSAVLFIVDIKDGSLIAKLDTRRGYLADPLGSARPNGLSTPVPVDSNGDYVIDYIYAGDLFGNLWKFDVTNSSPSQWAVTYGTAGSPVPMFTACAGTTTCTTGSGSNYQPITTRPEVGRHPTQPGFIIYFGTGKYFESGDAVATGQTTQSFYALWDQNNGSTSGLTRGDLLQQQILTEVTKGSAELRVISDNPIRWTATGNQPAHGGWYLDLINSGNASAGNLGERQVTDPSLRNGRIIFTTLVPSSDPCDAGGSGWLMELNAANGGRLDVAPFDINNDNAFTITDLVNTDTAGNSNTDGAAGTVAPGGIRYKDGIISQPGILSESNGTSKTKEHKLMNSSSGKIKHLLENGDVGYNGRTSWIELPVE